MRRFEEIEEERKERKKVLAEVVAAYTNKTDEIELSNYMNLLNVSVELRHISTTLALIYDWAINRF